MNDYMNFFSPCTYRLPGNTSIAYISEKIINLCKFDLIIPILIKEFRMIQIELNHDITVYLKLAYISKIIFNKSAQLIGNDKKKKVSKNAMAVLNKNLLLIYSKILNMFLKKVRLYKILSFVRKKWKNHNQSRSEYVLFGAKVLHLYFSINYRWRRL